MRIPKATVAALAGTAGLTFAVDQIAKAVIRHELTLCSAPPVRLCDRVSIAEPLGLLRTENADGALGLLAGSAIGPVMIVLLGILFWRAAQLRWTPLLASSIGLQLGGLVANLADRALFGAVTDFIDIRWGVADKGLVLNPADIGLAAGGLIFAVLLSRSIGPGPQAANGDRLRGEMGTAPDGRPVAQTYGVAIARCDPQHGRTPERSHGATR